ncbi:MAG TPA: carbohydrate ABC transporter permease [Armatimonadota bacterium]|nr:carbohydrate ABC transporter permease [Armatimonadota bacterium]
MAQSSTTRPPFSGGPTAPPAAIRVRPARIATYVALYVLGALFLLPFLWAVGASFKTNAAVYEFPPTLIPRPFHPENYEIALSVLPFGLFALNSLVVTLACVVGQLLSGSAVAYSFARLRWPGRDLWFLVLLGTMMLPPQVTIVSTFVGWTQLRNWTGVEWVDTFKPLIIPSFLGGSGMLIFLMRQFFKTLPLELDDAARMDGCTTWGTFWRVMLPLSRPVLATVAVLSFIAHWHDFLGPLIYLNSVDKYTLQIGLRMFQDINGSRMNLLMAASMIVLLPVLILFFVAQRYLVKGIVLSGIKG